MRNKELTPLSGEERLKYEVARELGLMDKLLDVGWPGLTAGETGRIGSIMARKRRAQCEGR